MTKFWNLAQYHDGKPVRERRVVNQQDALTQIHFLSRTGVSLPVAERSRPVELETAELPCAA